MFGKQQTYLLHRGIFWDTDSIMCIAAASSIRTYQKPLLHNTNTICNVVVYFY